MKNLRQTGLPVLALLLLLGRLEAQPQHQPYSTRTHSDQTKAFQAQGSPSSTERQQTSNTPSQPGNGPTPVRLEPISPIATSPSPPQALRLSQLRQLKQLPDQLVVVVEPGEQLPLAFKIEGPVICGETKMDLTFTRTMYVKLQGQQEPLFSWNGQDWTTGQSLFTGIISAQIGKQGGEVRCLINER